MTSKRLPIIRFPHLFLAADDSAVQQRMVTDLQKKGFKVGASALTPPEGASGRQVIAAITASFQAVKAG